MEGSKEKQLENKGVDSVTDYVEEKENTNASAALAAVGNLNETKPESIVTFVIKEEDIKLLIDECEISRENAESLLKKSEGDVKKAMIAFLALH